MSWVNKHRPRKLRDITGQGYIKEVLKGSLIENDIMNSYILYGPYGIGKCVVGETLIYLNSERRSSTIKEVFERFKGGLEKEQVFKTEIEVQAASEFVKAPYFYQSVAERTVLIETVKGFRQGGTIEHPIRVLSEKGVLEWRPLSQLCLKDQIVLVRKVRQEEFAGSKKDSDFKGNFKKYEGKGFVLNAIENLIRSDLEFENENDAVEFQIKAFDHFIDTERDKNVVRMSVDDKRFLLGAKSGSESGILLGLRWKKNRSLGFLGRVQVEIRKAIRGRKKEMLNYSWDNLSELLDKNLDRESISGIFRVINGDPNLNFELLEKCPNELRTMSEFLKGDYFIDEVKEVKLIDKEVPVFDLVVPDGHAFKTGVFLSHNTSLARVFANALICKNRENKYEPCGKCEDCKEFLEGRHLDYLEVDGASRSSVNDIRKIRDLAGFKSWKEGKKIFYIDEVQDISKEANDALLKQLEEASENVVYLFCTTELEKIPKTVRSRSVLLQVKYPKVEELIERLRFVAEFEGVKYEEEALKLIAEESDLHIRDAVKSMEIASLKGVISVESVLEYFGLDLIKDIKSILIFLKDDFKSVMFKVEKILEKAEFRFLYSKLSEILIGIKMIELGIEKPILEKLLKDKEFVDKVKELYGEKILIVSSFLFRKMGEVSSVFEVILDLLLINVILNSDVGIKDLKMDLEKGIDVRFEEAVAKQYGEKKKAVEKFYKSARLMDVPGSGDDYLDSETMEKLLSEM